MSNQKDDVSAFGVAAGSAPLLVAWRVDLNDMHCIVFAATKAKAQWIAVKSYWEAYERRRGVWPRATAARIPLHDKSPLRFDPPRAYCEEYVY